MKRSPLQRKTPLARSGTIKAKPRRAPKRDTVEFGETTKKKVRIRADFRCELVGCHHHIQEFHHRKMRSAGGKGTILNCLALCTVHHRSIHDNTGWSYRHGLLVKGCYEPNVVAPITGCGIDCLEDHAAQ